MYRPTPGMQPRKTTSRSLYDRVRTDADTKRRFSLVPQNRQATATGPTPTRSAPQGVRPAPQDLSRFGAPSTAMARPPPATTPVQRTPAPAANVPAPPAPPAPGQTGGAWRRIAEEDPNKWRATGRGIWEGQWQDPATQPWRPTPPDARIMPGWMQADIDVAPGTPSDFNAIDPTLSGDFVQGMTRGVHDRAQQEGLGIMNDFMARQRAAQASGAVNAPLIGDIRGLLPGTDRGLMAPVGELPMAEGRGEFQVAPKPGDESGRPMADPGFQTKTQALTMAEADAAWDNLDDETRRMLEANGVTEQEYEQALREEADAQARAEGGGRGADNPLPGEGGWVDANRNGAVDPGEVLTPAARDLAGRNVGVAEGFGGYSQDQADAVERLVNQSAAAGGTSGPAGITDPNTGLPFSQTDIDARVADITEAAGLADRTDEAASAKSDFEKAIQDIMGFGVPTLDRSKVDAKVNAQAQSDAARSSQRMRVAMEMLARGGASPESMSGALADQGHAADVEASVREAQTRLSAEMTDLQQRSKQYATQIQALMALADRAKTDYEREQAYAIARELAKADEATKARLMELAAELDSPDLGAAVLQAGGSLLGGIGGGLLGMLFPPAAPALVGAGAAAGKAVAG